MKSNRLFATVSNWLAPPAFADTDKSRRAALLNQILVFLVVVTILHLPILIFVVPNSGEIALFTTFATFLAVSCLFIMRRGHVQVAAGIFLATLWSAFSFELLFSNGIANPIVLGYFILILLAGMLTRQRGIIITLIASVGSIMFVYLLEANHALPDPLYAKTSDYIWLNTTTMMVAAAGVMLLHSRSIAEALAQAQINAQNAQRSEARLRDAIESLNDAFAIFDSQGSLLLHNSEYDQLVAAHNMPADLVWPASKHPTSDHALEQLLPLNEAALECEIRQMFDSPGVRLRQNGTDRWFEITERSMGDGGSVRVYKDVTERIKAARALRDTEKQLRHAQKMEAIGQLTAGIAHDFNNFLTAINVSAQLIQLGLKQEDSLQKKVSQILDASQHATNLVRQLMSFSSQQIIEARALNVNDAICQVYEMLKHTIGDHIYMERTLADSLWSVKMDPSQVEQILLNLFLNARDAMPQGGSLKISTDNLALPDDLSASPFQVGPGEYVRLAIADSGLGMDAELQARIFEPFFTTKDVGKGTGLGLATVYGITEQAGGTICVSSVVGQGTTFTLLLPRCDEADLSQHQVNTAEAAPAGQETLLLVEDNEAVRGVAADILRQQGYEIVAARDGLDALQLAADRAEPYDLVLTDIVMPGMGGTQLVKTLQERWPQIKVIYMSGYANKAIDQEEVRHSRVNFVQKPFQPDALIRKVREILDAEAVKAEAGSEQLSLQNDGQLALDT